MRASRSGPLAGVVVQMVLLGVLAATVGLSAGGWAAGIVCVVALNAGVARLIVRDGCARLGPATWVTLGRASLGVGLAALTAEALGGGGSTPVLVGLAIVARAL